MNAIAHPHVSNRTQYVEGPFLDLISKIVDRTNEKLAREIRPARNNYGGSLSYRLGHRFNEEFRQLLGKQHS